MTKFFKSKKKQAAPQPRTMEEIQKAHAQALAAVANSQYLVYIHTKEVENLNQQILWLNQEAAARKALDAKNASKEEPKQETT